MFQATITYRGPLGKKVKGLSKVVKAGLTDALVHWHQKNLPLHFAPYTWVSGRYPGQFTKRGRSYTSQKAKKYHHQNVLEYSGELKRNVLRGVSIVGSAKSARARLPGSQKANFRPASKGKEVPNMRAELTAVNEVEAKAMAGILDAKVTAFLNSNEGTEVVRI